DTVALMLPTGRDYLVAFFGALVAGAVPVPIYPPSRPSQLEEHVRRQARILANAEARVLVTNAEAKTVARLRASLAPTVREVTTVDALSSTDAAPPRPRIDAGSTAFLQYTSGSTGQPKGVIVSHANALANVRALGHVVGFDAKDTVVSWLP